MLLDVITNKITEQSYVATVLQLPFCLGANFIERIIYQYCLLTILWKEWKNFLSIRKKSEDKKPDSWIS